MEPLKTIFAIRCCKRRLCWADRRAGAYVITSSSCLAPDYRDASTGQPALFSVLGLIDVV